jgi:hypothetical protein
MFCAFSPMKDDDLQRRLYEAEIERLKRERKSTEKATGVVFFLAIWLLPLFGMMLEHGDNPPAVAGPISVWGIWFLTVPAVYFLYRKFR